VENPVECVLTVLWVPGETLPRAGVNG